MYKYLEMLEKFEKENELMTREDRARAYSRKCKRNAKRKIVLDWQSEDCTMYVLAGSLLFMLVAIML